VRDEYTSRQAAGTGQGHAHRRDLYAVMPSPTDGSVWGTLRGNPGAVVRIDPTKNPHKSLAEQYNVPMPGFARAAETSTSKGACGLARERPHGVFDRRLCKGPLNGPKATGDHCPEAGVPPVSGPGFKGIARTAPRRATTRGSTSTTPSGLATTSRCRPPT